jgi:hypothetical protein
VSENICKIDAILWQKKKFGEAMSFLVKIIKNYGSEGP